jgi:DedD protein
VKYRIIGALLLLGLAVIILPFFLDGAGYQEIRQVQAIPAEPEPASVFAVETVDISDPELVSISVTDHASSVEPQRTEPETDTSLLAVNGLPQGWSVQMGHFKNQQNAIRLQVKYQAAGYKVYVVPAGESYRVLAGPVLNRDQALHLKAELLDQFKQSDLFVVRYELEQ